MAEKDSFVASEQTTAQPKHDGEHLNLLALADCNNRSNNDSTTCLRGQEIIRTNPMIADRPGNSVHSNYPSLEISNDAQAPKLPAGDYLEHIKSDGRNREFELHLPRDYDGKSPLPVVYMFHGLTENMDMMREYSQMNKLADEKGFAVAYMQADKQPFPNSLEVYSEASWNLDHGTLTPKDPSYNDLDYIKQVKNIVENEANIDQKREYLAGFSEGGQAASYIAQQMPHTFAGIASVHGTLIDSDPRPSKADATPFLSILGNNDHILPEDGGAGLLLSTVNKAWSSKPLEQAKAWAAADGATHSVEVDTPESQTTFFTDGTQPVEQIVRLKHESPDGTRGGSHAWDGGNNGLKGEPHPDFIQWISRPVRQSDPDFDASRTVADFLLKNSLK
ncbi:MAG TPA: alpha/beta hydrolase-fold protein [Drouetiella sp.]